MSFNSKIIDKFSTIILEDDTHYTVSEMKKILGEVYKEIKNEKSDTESDGEGEKKSKRSKKNTDKPKKAPSAYNIFIRQKILELKESDNFIPPKELMKVASTYWSKLSDDEKKTFKEENM